MNDIITNFTGTSEPAKEVIYFNDGRMQAKNETTIYNIISKVFWISIVIIIIGNIIFKNFLSTAESSSIAVGLFIIAVYLKKKGGHERRECPSELRFYEDFFVFYVPKHHVKKGQDCMELSKMYYKDVKLCKYRTVIHKFDIFGIADFEVYYYDKTGGLSQKKPYKNHIDGMIKFYTVFDNRDFIKIIEENTPIKVQLENS